MKLGAWIVGLGLGLMALSGCSSTYVVHSAQRDPSCEDQCILDGADDLAMCLQECGGGDFTASLGCQEDDHRAACGAIPLEPEESAGGSFLAALIDTAIDIADTASDIHDATSSHHETDEEQPLAEPAGPAPEERDDPPKHERKRDSDREPARPSKSREPAKPSKG
ncbi:MAG: hypothetical protein KC766_31670 [Myxococcales bacterium]|nr:hypothetical protein [Myxococcales bacterium]